MPQSPRSNRSSPFSYNEKSPYPNAIGGPSKGGRQSGLKSRNTQLLAIRFGWVVLIIWYEVGEFFSSLSSCKFPDSILRRSTSSYSTTSPTHVVLLADPHVPHPTLSYPSDSKPWINWLRQQMEELFMRKSWNVVMRLGRIDTVVVVGDMLDWGRGVMSDQEYDRYFDAFRSIFKLPDSIPMYFVPGNHDLPLGPNRLFSPNARDRYLKHFSPPNAILPVANHTLILLDSIGLVEEDYRRYAAETQFGEWEGMDGGVIEFVKDVGEEFRIGPKILISHIPLARQEAATCGPLRERGRISKGAGPGYQNLLGSETSRFLLDELKPSIVFSGDDHDYCEHIHPGGIREVTIKSFSSSAGIRRPGFQLLSLIPPSDLTVDPPQITHADRPCFLPDQLGVYYRVYLPLGILTISYLFFTNTKVAYARWSANRQEAKSRGNSPHPGSTPIAQSTARFATDRNGILAIPSRGSSQKLHMNGSAILRSSSRIASHHYPGELLSPGLSSASAPASPTISSRPSFSEDSYSYIHGDEEADSEAPTPSISRRSSYVWMHGSDPGHHSSHNEPNGYFSNTAPGHGANGIGLGLSTPTGAYGNVPPNSVLQRSASGHASFPPAHPSRRVTMPRMLSTQDWVSAAKAKDKSVLGLMAESLPLPSNGKREKRNAGAVAAGGGLKAMHAFTRWLWKARNGVLARSWREVLAVAWPAALSWVLVNLLFFIG